METTAVAKPPVAANGSALTFNNIESLQRLAAYLHASRMLPKQYDTPEKIGAGIQYAVQLGFRDSWLLALRQIAVINGTPSMFGDLPLALARGSGLLEEFEEFLIDKDGAKICMENKNIFSEFVAACCRVKRKGYPPVEKLFTVNDAKTAGIFGANVWKVYPKRMIQMRARSIALKDEFADVLNGMSIGEYDHNTIIEKVVDNIVVDSKPEETSGAAKLNAMIAQATPVDVVVEAGQEADAPQEAPAVAEPAKTKSKAELVSEMFELTKKLGISMKDITARCKNDFGKEPAKMAEKDLEMLNLFLTNALGKEAAQ
jgi:hypothetical protein